jgi:hypothetical protein
MAARPKPPKLSSILSDKNVDQTTPGIIRPLNKGHPDYDALLQELTARINDVFVKFDMEFHLGSRAKENGRGKTGHLTLVTGAEGAWLAFCRRFDATVAADLQAWLDNNPTKTKAKASF